MKFNLRLDVQHDFCSGADGLEGRGFVGPQGGAAGKVCQKVVILDKIVAKGGEREGPLGELG